MKTSFGFESAFGDEVEWYDSRDGRFDLYGLIAKDGDQFRRVPQDVADATNAGVSSLSRNTAGGRVRFRTDSPFVCIYAKMPMFCRMDHCAFTGSSAFDLFVKNGARFTFADSFRPPVDAGWGYEKQVFFPDASERELIIHFPTYSEVSDLYIGVARGSTVKNGGRYKYEKPVVYYGSSITQGACACRPGNAYEAIISNEWDCDHINLGFSGSACAEDAICDYICSLDMSVFVMDYDHNAPSADYLESTHEKFFKKFRAAKPDVPVVMVTRPTFNNDVGPNTAESFADRVRCREIVFCTYMNALRSGDTNVEFIDGASLFNGPYADLCTVDGIHPNDAGFFRMATRIGAAVGRFLEKSARA